MVFISGTPPPPAFLLNITVLAVLLNRYVQVLIVNSCSFRISLLLFLYKPATSLRRTVSRGGPEGVRLRES